MKRDKENLKMKREEIHSFCDDVNSFIHSHYRYKRDPVRVVNNGYVVQGKRASFNLYLRWYPTESCSGKNTLEIGQVRFNPNRKGKGTSFLEFIANNSIKYCINTVVIESTNENSSAFAKKFGFEKDFKGYIHNWGISTKKLRKYFGLDTV